MFSGYPYFHGNNDPLKGASPNQNANVTQPISNQSQFNSGVSLLPPPQAQSLPSHNAGKTTSSVVGAIYNFDSYSGANRFPKVFDQNLLMFDFEWQDTHMFVSKLEANGNLVKAGPQINVSKLLGGVFMKSTLDAEFSPSGELFLLNVGDNTYGNCGNQCGSIDKVVYTGGQCPQSVSLQMEKPKFNIFKNGNTIQANLTSPLQISIYSIKGDQLFSKILAPNHSLNIKSELRDL